jgi:hypothetical protein
LVISYSKGNRFFEGEARMKESEFEAKLTTVSDAKLVQMLLVGRRDGPEVAVKMIMAEGSRRGLEGMEDSPESLSLSAQVDPGVEAAMSEAASEAIGYADLAPVEEESSPEPQLSDENGGDAPKWLTEENSSGKFPPLLKALLFIVALGVVLAVAYSLIHRG